MRLFWLIIAVLVLCSVVALARRDAGARLSAPVSPISSATSDAEPAITNPLGIGTDNEFMGPLHPSDLRHFIDWTGVTPRDLIRPPKRQGRRGNAEPVEFTPPTGSGMRDDPFVLTWETLAYARQTFDPRRGMDELPEGIAALDDRYVAIEGYYLAPWASDEIEEMLLMRFAWDGCCIGVPPSAYTAIESTMRQPVRRRSVIDTPVITLFGRMKVEPFVDGDWLLSLYRIEEGEVR